MRLYKPFLRIWRIVAEVENGKEPRVDCVYEFLRKGIDGVLERPDALPVEHRETYQKNLVRLGKLHRIREYSYTVDQLSGEYSVDKVVDIFNRVNKAGTPLTRAHLVSWIRDFNQKSRS